MGYRQHGATTWRFPCLAETRAFLNHFRTPPPIRLEYREWLPFEYRDIDNHSTAMCPPSELPLRLARAEDSARNYHGIERFQTLRCRRTVPRLATGSPRFSYPQTLSGGAIACRGLPVAMRASAILPEASVRLPPKDGAARLPPGKPSSYRPLVPQKIGD